MNGIDAPVADDVHVVSDLHLGGERGFQIFKEGPALARTIADLSAQRATEPGRRRWFVVNGDFVDFLAESSSRLFDPLGAAAKLRRIAADPAFAPVFAAMSEFLDGDHHRLGIVIGNHDVELALPWVRAELVAILCAGVDGRAARIVFSLEGQGLLLRVGDARGPRVLCVHGNEVDGWNVVDHDAVRLIGREGLRDNRIDEDYVPNAGSRMVVQVMNQVKKRYPFVDLLKPETEAVVPTLLALDPSSALNLAAIARLRAGAGVNDLRIRAGFLGADTPLRDGGAIPGAVAWSPARATRAGTRLENREIARDLLDRAEERLLADEDPADLLRGGDPARYLGKWGAVAALATGNPAEALRRALESLAGDRSFDPFARDATFDAMDRRVSTNIDFLVTGHTHLARALERVHGHAFYFNTGTWARVFGIRAEALSDQPTFETLLAALRADNIEALDAAPGLAPVRPHVAVIWADANGVHGELRSVAADAAHTCTAVPHTRFDRS